MNKKDYKDFIELGDKYEKVQKDYLMLEGRYLDLQNEYNNLQILLHANFNENFKNIQKSYISKDKIRDRIEQLESYYDSSKETTPTSTNQFIIDVVAILEELLEEGGAK